MTERVTEGVNSDIIKTLKPCPFCGSTRLAICEDTESTGKRVEWVECCNSACGILGPIWRVTKGHTLAIKYWNRRMGKGDDEE